MSSHTMVITCVKWGGEGLIYSCSRDRTINVWDATDGKLVRSLKGHGHWVNTLALSSEHALRTGPFDHHGQRPKHDADAQKVSSIPQAVVWLHCLVTLVTALCLTTQCARTYQKGMHCYSQQTAMEGWLSMGIASKLLQVQSQLPQCGQCLQLVKICLG